MNVYLIDEASTTEFSSEAMTKNLVEPILMMIETLPGRVVNTPNVNHCVQWVQNLPIPLPPKIRKN